MVKASMIRGKNNEHLQARMLVKQIGLEVELTIRTVLETRGFPKRFILSRKDAMELADELDEASPADSGE